MQNRMLRLGTQAQIRQRLTELVSKKINIVLNDNTVILAEVLEASATVLKIQNMRRQKLSVAISDIYEIIIDINA